MAEMARLDAWRLVTSELGGRIYQHLEGRIYNRRGFTDGDDRFQSSEVPMGEQAAKGSIVLA